MYTVISGFWALGVVVVASGIAMLFSRGDDEPKPGSLTGKFMFIILGAMFALLGVLGVCGTVTLVLVARAVTALANTLLHGYPLL